MALIKCVECSKEISDRLGTVCPNCGFKVDETTIQELRENELKLQEKEEVRIKEEEFNNKQIGLFGLFFSTYFVYSITFLLMILLWKGVFEDMNLASDMNNKKFLPALYHTVFSFIVMNVINVLMTNKFFNSDRIGMWKKNSNYILGFVLSIFNIYLYLNDDIRSSLFELVVVLIVALMFIAGMNSRNTVNVRVVK